MLKAEMHTHCKDDSNDFWIRYTAEELMKAAAEKGYDVLSITLHEEMYFPERYKKKAEELGILLIPGVELRINDKDVLAYNITEEEANSIKTLEDLEKIRRDDTLIVAPHPYLPFASSLHDSLDEYHEYFDAVEKTLFYLPFFKFWNKKAERAANKYGLSLVANSDVHNLKHLGYSYTLVDAEKDVDSVIKAIKEGKVKIKSKPLSLLHFASIIMGDLIH